MINPKEPVVTPKEGYQFSGKMKNWDFEHCPNCEANQWFGIPDSLACVCENCGFVRVGSGGDYSAGATLGEWARDLYERKAT